MVQQVDRGVMTAADTHNQGSAGSAKSSTGSVHHVHTKKSSNIIPDKRKILCELLVQLAKVGTANKQAIIRIYACTFTYLMISVGAIC